MPSGAAVCKRGSGRLILTAVTRATPSMDMNSPAKRGLWRAGVAVVFWALVLGAGAFASRLLLDVTIPWDAKAQFHNFFRFVGLALARGEAPLWNPYHFSGFPSVADPQSFLFSPTFLVAAWVMPDASPMAFDALVIGHLVAGAAAAGLLMLRLGLSVPAACLAVAIVLFGGPAMGRLQHVGQIVSYAWLPVCLLLLRLALQEGRARMGFAFGLAAALMALGRDQVAYLNCIVLAAAALAAFAAAPAPLAWVQARVRVAAAIVVTGIAVLAVPLLLTLQFASVSNRPRITFETAAHGSLDPHALGLAFIANLLAGLSAGDLYWGPGSQRWPSFGWTDRSVLHLYIGAPALIAILAGLVAAPRVFARAAAFPLLAGLALVLYALGDFTPLFRFLFDHLPGVAIYRRPVDATFPLMVMVAWTAAVGLDAARGRSLAIMVALAASAAILALAALPLAHVPTAFSDAAIRAATGASVGWSLIALALATFALWFAPGARARVAFAMVASLDLALTAAVMPINAEARRVYAVLADEPSPDKAALDRLKSLLAAEHARGRYPRVEILGPEAGWQNVGMAHGIEDTLGYNPLRVALYQMATGAAEVSHEPRLRPFPKTFRGYRSRLARLLGIEFLVFDTPFERMPAGLPRLRLSVIREGPPIWIYRLPPAAPRAYLATRAIRVDSATLVRQADLPDFALPHEALIEANDPLDEALAAAPPERGAPPGRVEIATYGLNEVRLIAETDRTTILVLHDLHYPGWVVRVNGERQPLLRANVLFRGVVLAPGRNDVSFRFEPFSLENIAAAARSLR